MIDCCVLLASHGQHETVRCLLARGAMVTTNESPSPSHQRVGGPTGDDARRASAARAESRFNFFSRCNFKIFNFSDIKSCFLRGLNFSHRKFGQYLVPCLCQLMWRHRWSCVLRPGTGRHVTCCCTTGPACSLTSCRWPPIHACPRHRCEELACTL